MRGFLSSKRELLPTYHSEVHFRYETSINVVDCTTEIVINMPDFSSVGSGARLEVCFDCT